MENFELGLVNEHGVVYETEYKILHILVYVNNRIIIVISVSVINDFKD